MLSVPCPGCSGFVAYGAIACGACGKNLLEDAQSGESTCAVHPDRKAKTTCERCGAFACAQCLREGERGAPWCVACFDRVPQDLTPWDRRSELGLWKAFFQTAWATVSRPKSFFEEARSEGSIGSSLLFALMASVFAYVPTFGVYLVIFGATTALREEAAGAQSVSPAVMVGIFGGYMILGPLFSAGWTLVQGAMDHLVLKIAGERLPFSVTYRGTALSMGPMLFGLVPICSVYVVPFWVLVVRLFAYAGLHRTSAGKGALGAFFSSAVCCIGVGGFYVALIAFYKIFASPAS